jgi:hypothetical protein
MTSDPDQKETKMDPALPQDDSFLIPAQNDSRTWVAAIPDLPALDSLLEDAGLRLQHFLAIRDQAQAQIDNCEAYIAALSGKPKQKKYPKNVSAPTLKAILTSIGSHNGCSVETVAKDAGCGLSTIHRAVRTCPDLVRVEKRGARNRFWLTEAGLEYLTR